MKRFAQCAALLVLAMLIAQPALAALACAPGAAMCVPGCPMQMSDMGSDCPMNLQVAAASGCPLGCCAVSAPESAALGVSTEKRQLDTASAVVLSALVDTSSQPAIAPVADISVPPGAPPLYLLHRAFRN